MFNFLTCIKNELDRCLQTSIDCWWRKRYNGIKIKRKQIEYYSINESILWIDKISKAWYRRDKKLKNISKSIIIIKLEEKLILSYYTIK